MPPSDLRSPFETRAATLGWFALRGKRGRQESPISEGAVAALPARPAGRWRLRTTMADLLFYHLETQPLERVLPQLVEKTLERGWRAVIETASPERAEVLDSLLWTFREDSFVPHGTVGSDVDADQPVLITTEADNPNGAHVRFFVDRAVPQSTEGYERVVFMFSGHDPDAVTEARVAWKALQVGNALTYWQQDDAGRWVKKG